MTKCNHKNLSANEIQTPSDKAVQCHDCSGWVKTGAELEQQPSLTPHQPRWEWVDPARG